MLNIHPCNSLQMPNCPTYSKTMLLTNRNIAAKMPPGSEGSSLTREHNFAVKGEEWMATSERESGPKRVSEVTGRDAGGDDAMQQVSSEDCISDSQCVESKCLLAKEGLETQAMYLDRENLCTVV